MTVLRLALEGLHHADVLRRLVDAVARGDTDAFAGTADRITWAGGWESAIRAMLPFKSVPDAIQTAFENMWLTSEREEFGIRRTLSTDLIGKERLLVDGLRLLLPPTKPNPMPATIYRGQNLADHLAGHRGCWWTADRDFAQFFARSRINAQVGVVLAADFVPDAVIYGPNDLDILVDPCRLGPVRVVEARAVDWGAEKIAA